ncbi:MAG: Fic family protein [Methylococcaceae bacterium]|nr:Fic family protein [Methylococcaceae bacterium]
MSTLIDLLDHADKLKIELDQYRNWENTNILEALAVEYTYDSNRIEGNTLTLRETDLVIHKGLTIAGKALNEHLEAINHYQAIHFIRDLIKANEPFNKHSLLSIHSLILHGIDRDNAGRYRQVPVMISGSQHTPPQPWQIEKLMEDYFLFYQQQKTQLHPIIFAAELHEQLATIHPFIDGNGRTARLIMNLTLLQSGFPITNINGDSESRLSYYSALEKCNIEQDKTDFYKLITEYTIASLERLLQLIKTI